MNNMAIGIYQYLSLGEALAQIHDKSGLLEVIPMGLNTTVIFENNEQYLSKISSNSKLIIDKPHPLLLKTYLSLENSNILSSLMIIESKLCTELFDLTNQGLYLNYKVVDFRIPRTESMTGFVLLTSELDINPLEKNTTKNSKVMIINQVSEELKSHYNLF